MQLDPTAAFFRWRTCDWKLYFLYFGCYRRQLFLAGDMRLELLFRLPGRETDGKIGVQEATDRNAAAAEAVFVSFQ